MSTFAFETITAAQALAIAATDTLTVAPTTGAATDATVIYATDGSNDVAVSFAGGQTVVFGPGFTGLAETPGSLTFTGTNTTLYVGDANANNFNSNTFSATSPGQSGAAFGGAGDDNLFENGISNLLQGNAGNDTLTSLGSDTSGDGSKSSNIVYGGQGNDFDQPRERPQLRPGQQGRRYRSPPSANTDTLLGGQGNDNISDTGDGPGNILDGNLGDDVLHGSGPAVGRRGQ